MSPPSIETQVHMSPSVQLYNHIDGCDDSVSNEGSNMEYDIECFPYDWVEDEIQGDDDDIENDGCYSDNLTWIYWELSTEEELQQPNNMYSHDGPALNHEVAPKFMMVLGAVAVCGGFDYNLLMHITSNSNQYACAYIDLKGNFNGSTWKEHNFCCAHWCIPKSKMNQMLVFLNASTCFQPHKKLLLMLSCNLIFHVI